MHIITLSSIGQWIKGSIVTYIDNNHHWWWIVLFKNKLNDSRVHVQAYYWGCKAWIQLVYTSAMLLSQIIKIVFNRILS